MLDKLQLQNKKGQFLVESIIAIGIITFGLLGLLALLSSSISLNRVVSDRYLATYLAGEGIEVVKSIVDANIINGRPWNSGISNGSFEVEYNSNALQANQNRYLNFNAGTFTYSYQPGGSATPFRRMINIVIPSGSEIRVTSNVTWITRGIRAGGNLSLSIEDRLFNWR